MLIVTTPSTATALTTPEAVIAALGDDEAPDDLQERIIAASADCVGYCNRTFALETVVETFRRGYHRLYTHGGAPRLMLTRGPLTELTSVVEDGIALTKDVDFEVEAADPTTPLVDFLYRLTGYQRIPWTAYRVVVTYSAGFVLPSDPDRETTLPADLERACIEAVVQGIRRTSRDQTIMSESEQGVGSMSYFDASRSGGYLPTEVRQRLDRYARIGL